MTGAATYGCNADNQLVSGSGELLIYDDVDRLFYIQGEGRYPYAGPDGERFALG